MKKELQRCMTSELLFAAQYTIDDKEQEIYITEYKRRLSIICYSNEQIKKMLEADETAISKGCYIKISTLLISDASLCFSTTVDYIDLSHCTFSELVLLTCKANILYASDYKYQNEKTKKFITKFAFNCNAEAALEIQSRMQSLDICYELQNNFIRHEYELFSSFSNTN